MHCLRAALNSEMRRRATNSGCLRECSQTRITRQPDFRRNRFVARSLIAFWRILRCQYAGLFFGIRPCQGQSCQKHPSTNIARRSRRKMKSGLPGSGWWRDQPLIRCSRRIAASFNSVLLFPVERTARITSDRLVFEAINGIAFSAKAPSIRWFL